MIHNVPAQGHTNHGLFNYTVKFVFMLCRSNKYKLLYLGYSKDETPHAFPDKDIVDFRKMFGDDAVSRVEHMELHDVALTFAVERTSEQDFVPPLDVPTGTPPASEEIRKRYWTVFEGGAF
jgi:hypothetical protein